MPQAQITRAKVAISGSKHSMVTARRAHFDNDGAIRLAGVLRCYTAVRQGRVGSMNSSRRAKYFFFFFAFRLTRSVRRKSQKEKLSFGEYF